MEGFGLVTAISIMSDFIPNELSLLLFLHEIYDERRVLYVYTAVENTMFFSLVDVQAICTYVGKINYIKYTCIIYSMLKDKINILYI